MNDLEISRALALAIGWSTFNYQLETKKYAVFFEGNWRVFDYRDWNVIGPIAERYNLFPWRAVGGWVSGLDCTFADTPQKAIALAVIEARK